MRILYLSQRFSFEKSGIYADLMNALIDEGHEVTIVSCASDNNIEYNVVKDERNSKIVNVKVGDQFGVNVIKKAYIQMMIPISMLRGIKKNFWSQDFDLILYPTPTITFAPIVKKCKKKFKAKTFLMLKDIFPQNAVDLGMIRKDGIVHRIYKKIELSLYKNSDHIGCMSEANVKYITDNYSAEIAQKAFLYPNTIDCTKLEAEKTMFREDGKHTVFLFGGNMGKPQAIDFLLECIKELNQYEQAKFILIGKGSESKRVKEYIRENNLKNTNYLEPLPREEYEKLVNKCDVGLVMLNYNFTIPNYPARTLSYLAKGLPVLAATDEVTDIRDLINEKAKCGMWCASNDKKAFCAAVKELCEISDEELRRIGERGKAYLKKNFDVHISVKEMRNRI